MLCVLHHMSISRSCLFHDVLECINDSLNVTILQNGRPPNIVPDVTITGAYQELQKPHVVSSLYFAMTISC